MRTAVGRIFSRAKKSCEGVVVRREDQSGDFREGDGVDADLEVERKLSSASPGVWLVFVPSSLLASSFCDGYEAQRLGHRMASLLPTKQLT